eukprot:6186867-Pleurochrysis_carterae.AAC.5
MSNDTPDLSRWSRRPRGEPNLCDYQHHNRHAYETDRRVTGAHRRAVHSPSTCLLVKYEMLMSERDANATVRRYSMMADASPLPSVFVAVDTPDVGKAQALLKQVCVAGVGVKLGLEFFSANGSQGVKAVQEAAPGVPLFLDLKFHDIPNTVAGAVKSVVPLGLTIINVHASGGAPMMRAAVQAAEEAARAAGVPRPLVIAVTVLTSMDEIDLKAVGQSVPADEQVIRLASLAKECGMDGVVCSAREIGLIRQACGPDFVLVVPGIRPAGSAQGDQKRVMTPADAMRAGATSLVVGRPITSSDDPSSAAQAIVNECKLSSK